MDVSKSFSPDEIVGKNTKLRGVLAEVETVALPIQPCSSQTPRPIANEPVLLKELEKDGLNI